MYVSVVVDGISYGGSAQLTGSAEYQEDMNREHEQSAAEEEEEASPAPPPRRMTFAERLRIIRRHQQLMPVLDAIHKDTANEAHALMAEIQVSVMNCLLRSDYFVHGSANGALNPFNANDARDDEYEEMGASFPEFFGQDRVEQTGETEDENDEEIVEEQEEEEVEQEEEVEEEIEQEGNEEEMEEEIETETA
jgi:hypothetical protein